MSELKREEFEEAVNKTYMCIKYDEAKPFAEALLAHDAALRAQLAAVTKERDDAVKVQVHMAKEYQTRLAAAQATIAGYRNAVDIYTEQFQHLESRTTRLERDYMELIMAVGTKYQDETRHQTALRYIQQAERRGDNEQAEQALAEESGKCQ